MNEFDNYNGFLIEKGDKLFNTGNRSFKYGDGLFETIKVSEGKIMFWDDHYLRLKSGMELLQIDDAKHSKSKWEQEIEKIVYKNKYQYAKLRLTVYRESPGMYTPMSNKLGYVVEGVRYDKKDFDSTDKKIRLEPYRDVDKGVNQLSNCKTTSSLLYVMASIYKKKQGFDDVVVFNNYDRVCETSNSNIFTVKNYTVQTPALSEGCIAGVMRANVLKYCAIHKVEVQEVEMSEKDLEEADEIFTTNVITGVVSVGTYKGQEKQDAITKKVQGFFLDL